MRNWSRETSEVLVNNWSTLRFNIHIFLSRVFRCNSGWFHSRLCREVLDLWGWPGRIYQFCMVCLGCEKNPVRLCSRCNSSRWFVFFFSPNPLAAEKIGVPQLPHSNQTVVRAKITSCHPYQLLIVRVTRRRSHILPKAMHFDAIFRMSCKF